MRPHGSGRQARNAHPFFDRQITIIFRIASGRDGFGVGCEAIHASRAARSSGYTRTKMGVASVLGLPRPLFFSILPVDSSMPCRYYKNHAGARPQRPLRQSPQSETGMTYEDYIRSPRWAELRQEALARDGHRCRACNTTERLEVHHRSYPAVLGSETVDDLTTLCGGPDGCHHAITTVLRRRRYEAQEITTTVALRVAPGRTERTYELQEITVPPHRRVTPGHA